MRGTRLTAGLSALALLATASVADAQGRQKFEYWYGLTGQLGEVMAEHCKRFNESQTKFEAVCVGQGGYDKAEQNTIAAFRSKQHPTIVQIYDAGTVNFMLSGATYNAVQFVKDFGMKVKWEDYFPGISNYYATSKGEMWSFPYNSSTALLYWNKEHFGKVGLTEAPKTVEEWFDAVRKIKAGGHAESGFCFDFDTWMPLEQFSAIHNEPIASKNNGYDGLDAEVVFNKGKFAQYMKDWKKLLDEGAARIATAQTGKTILQGFADGTCSSMLSSVANHGVIGSTAKAGLQWGVGMLPIYAGTDRKNSLVGGASLWVMQGKSKEEYEAAAAFLDFVLSTAEVEWMPNVTGYIPITNSAYQDLVTKGFYKQPDKAGREIAIQSLTFTPPTAISRGIRLGNFTQIRAEIRSELEAGFTGKKEMQVALDDAAARSNQILRRFEQTFKDKKLP
ncbi:MAG: extracellular solute-binding protein [Hyphomicrobiales bacterium]|nr:extracellular solute-binding protein [Hyphomicrobiales bacterium]